MANLDSGSFWSRNRSAARDAEAYRQGYPGGSDNLRLTRNAHFYSNQLASSPSGDLIDNIHRKWFGDYSLLERHHGYIQWLFPIREHGMNGEAQVLQPHEAKHIRESVECSRRIINSYRLMLDFYGMVLVDETTGRLARHTTNWKSRYDNLSFSSHNWLRVTRILKCLGEMGFEHYKAPFMAHIFEEIYEGKRPLKRCESSACYFWLAVLRSDAQRAEFVTKVDSARQRIEGAKRTKKPSKPRQRSFWSHSSDDDDDEEEEETSPADKSDGKSVDNKASSPAVAATSNAAPAVPLSAWYPAVPCTGYALAACLATLPTGGSGGSGATPVAGFNAVVATAAASSPPSASAPAKGKVATKKCPAKNCGAPANKICGRCRKIWFCSPECQKAHWQLHQASCQPATDPTAAVPATTTTTSSPAVAPTTNVIAVAPAPSSSPSSSPSAAIATNGDGVAVHGYHASVPLNGAATTDHDDSKHTADSVSSATASSPPPAASS